MGNVAKSDSMVFVFVFVIFTANKLLMEVNLKQMNFIT